MKNSVDALNLRLFSFFFLNYVSWRKAFCQSFENEMKIVMCVRSVHLRGFVDLYVSDIPVSVKCSLAGKALHHNV